MAGALEALDRAAGAEEKQRALDRYLALVNESGDSSWELLQNVYSPHSPATQGISIALALSRDFFRQQGLPGGCGTGGCGTAGSGSPGAACRVHGGGFAGTIQAYVPLDRLGAYRSRLEAVFGSGSVTSLRIRPLGAAELEF
jgi:galactokinase